MDILIGTSLVLLGIVLGELWRWIRGERAASGASHFRDVAQDLVDEITEQRQHTEAAMRRIVQHRRPDRDA